MEWLIVHPFLTCWFFAKIFFFFPMTHSSIKPSFLDKQISSMTNYNSSDSGIDLDRDYSSSSNDLNSSTSTLIESIPSSTSQRQINPQPVVKVISDGYIQRVRPVTMKNSTNGDYILCRTDRGNYIAYRTPVVPQWVTRLVEEIERIQR